MRVVLNNNTEEKLFFNAPYILLRTVRTTQHMYVWYFKLFGTNVKIIITTRKSVNGY